MQHRRDENFEITAFRLLALGLILAVILVYAVLVVLFWGFLRAGGAILDHLEEIAHESIAILLALLERGVDEYPYGDFELDPEYFDHVALWNESWNWVEMRLRSRCDQTVRVEDLDVTVRLRAGEDIRTEVSRCSANDNTGDGIAISGGCQVGNCTVENNGAGSGAGAVGSGVRVASGSGSRIESIHARDNHRYGIEAGAADVIIRNTSGNNGLGQYLPSSGTNFGPIQTPAAATNPAANF